jgi:hypothetical protein
LESTSCEQLKQIIAHVGEFHHRSSIFFAFNRLCLTDAERPWKIVSDLLMSRDHLRRRHRSIGWMRAQTGKRIAITWK